MSSVHDERYKKFLERLQLARTEAGMTQMEVAEAFGKPQSFVSKVESGERRVDVVELDEFAALYNKDLSFFLTGWELSSAAAKRKRR